MSKFLRPEYLSLAPYTPGEQPKDGQYIKLNTNESPFPPSPKAVQAAAKAAQGLNLYNDPDSRELVNTVAKHFGVEPSQVIMTNGSDQILNFAFIAFCHRDCPAVFADITYGFYKVFADVNFLPYEEIPLREDMSIDITDYFGAGKTIFIANPNAPTGLLLSVPDIEQILIHNPDNVVVIDEAYIDFGGESCVPLTKKYDNLLVTRTFSKSRSMAGARLGIGFGSEKLIADLNTVRFSLDPYNVNSMTAAAGIAAVEDEEYTRANCLEIMRTRSYLTAQMRKLGFELNDSFANFVFAKHPSIGGEEIYLRLKDRRILVRHFTNEKIKDYNRITIGTREQADKLLAALKEITEENAQ